MPRPVFDRPIAHRGLHDRAKGVIENSRSAFEAAIAGGYAIECDVQLSKDAEPFIFHDDSFDRLTAVKGASKEIEAAKTGASGPVNESVITSGAAKGAAKEAEAHAEEDKKKREAIEARNHALIVFTDSQ